MEFPLPVLLDGPQYLDLQQPQFPVGNNQEIATTAGRVEKRHLTQPFLKPSQLRKTAAISARL